MASVRDMNPYSQPFSDNNRQFNFTTGRWEMTDGGQIASAWTYDWGVDIVSDPKGKWDSKENKE